MIQHVMQELFGLVIFVYVDDCFWVVPEFTTGTSYTSAQWVSHIFREVVTNLFGWTLDPEKDADGNSMLLLGLRVSMLQHASTWVPNVSI